jgi:DNA-binding NtrC family response regulator
MIVDDEEAQLNSLKLLLSDRYEVIVDCGAREALDKIKKMDHPEDICLVISDQRMPVLTGIQLFERLVKILPNTIRIILTGYDETDVIRDSIKKNQIYDFLRKPVDPDVLMLKIKNAVEAYDYRQTVFAAKTHTIYREPGLDGDSEARMDKKQQEDMTASAKLPGIFYKPIKVKRYLKFDREELHRDV